MTLSTRIEVFYGFYICSQWAFIHALLSRVPFALAGLSCRNRHDISTFIPKYSAILVLFYVQYCQSVNMAIILCWILKV